MILAAGLGTRLRPLTDHTPKPLIPVAGVPMIERVARRLIAAGADRLIVNVSHLAGKVEAFLAEQRGFGVEHHLSPEPEAPLETGGALVAAEHLFRKDAPFFLHNGDILTDLPLGAMYRAHQLSPALATLAVMERETKRHLLFDDHGLLGRTDAGKDLEIRVRDAVGPVRKLAFGGPTRWEIIGVMPEGFAFPLSNTDVWIPMLWDRASRPRSRWTATRSSGPTCPSGRSKRRR